MAIVGEQFQTYISDQINKRQEIHGKENRSIEDLQYLNSKTAWVKLASGVSLKGDERIKDLGWNGIGQGTDLAKKYVLFGGTSFKSNNSTTLKQLEGFKTDQVWRNAYNVNAKQQKENLDFGFVPPPGIESVEVKNMNRGSIKKATVKIKAYSRDQFDILDILYMRLGYTVLLEWGWSHYFNNSGKLETMGYTLVEAEKGFFSTTAKSHRQFLPKIERYRKNKSGNYDGLLAKVSNFDWTFNPDGSYDITLTLISLGDIIESLKTNVSPRLIDVDFEEEDKPKDIISEYLYILKKFSSKFPSLGDITFSMGLSSKSIGYTTLEDTVYFNYKSTDEESNPQYNNLNYYIRFSQLLKKVKELCLPINSNDPNETIIDLKVEDMNMLCYPNQISFDPRICIVRGVIDNNILFPQLQSWRDQINGSAKIENIYVNFSTIQNAIDSNLDENNKLSLIPFFQSICNDLNRALGGINNLEPVVDEDTNILSIIDGSYISDDAYQDPPPYILEVFGYNPNNGTSNFVRNLDLKTQITPEYASMVTIGATAGGYVKGTEATMFSKWNKGIVDRFKEEYLPPSTTTENQEENIREPAINYIKYLKSDEKILGLDGNGNNILDDTVIDSNLSVVTEYYKYLNYIAQKEQDTFSSSTNGFIPFNLGVTMDGISGIKIYNKLNVSTRFLPKNYPDALHFIIKGVSHKISNQDWETTLETTVVPNSIVSTP
jgi:hypothetical protein